MLKWFAFMDDPRQTGMLPLLRDLACLTISPMRPRLARPSTAACILRMLRSVDVASVSISLTTRADNLAGQGCLARERRLHTGGDALADQGGFRFGHGADDGEHRSSHGTCGVDLSCRLMKRTPRWSNSSSAVRRWRVERAKRSNFRPGHNRVRGCERGHQGVEPGAPFAAAGNGNVAIFADDGETGALGVSTQAVILQVGLLVRGGDPQIERRTGSAAAWVPCCAVL